MLELLRVLSHEIGIPLFFTFCTGLLFVLLIVLPNEELREEFGTLKETCAALAAFVGVSAILLLSVYAFVDSVRILRLVLMVDVLIFLIAAIPFMGIVGCPVEKLIRSHFVIKACFHGFYLTIWLVLICVITYPGVPSKMMDHLSARAVQNLPLTRLLLELLFAYVFFATHLLGGLVDGFDGRHRMRVLRVGGYPIPSYTRTPFGLQQWGRPAGFTETRHRLGFEGSPEIAVFLMLFRSICWLIALAALLYFSIECWLFAEVAARRIMSYV